MPSELPTLLLLYRTIENIFIPHNQTMTVKQRLMFHKDLLMSLDLKVHARFG